MMDFIQSANISPAAIKPIRSWTDFFQTASFRTPTNMEEAQQRLTQNLKYFQSNYLVVFALLLVYCLLSNILFLLGFVASAAGLIGLSKLPADYFHTIGNFDIRVKHLQISWAILSLILLYLTSAGTIIFWSVGVAAVLISVHAVMHDVSVESDFSLPA